MKKYALKRILWAVMDTLLILVVLPFGFVMSYYFNLFFSGRNRPELFADLAAFSGSLTWVSCAFLVLIALILQSMIKNHKRWYSLFTVSLIGGGFLLFVLNTFVETTFTFWRSLFPLMLCCVVSIGYALGKSLYNDDIWNFTDEPQLDFHEDEREVLNEEQADELDEEQVEETINDKS